VPPTAPQAAVEPRTVLVPIRPESELPRVLPDDSHEGERLIRITAAERRSKRGAKRAHHEHEEHERRRHRGHDDDDD
jgi:hypothetical protein